MRVDELYVYFYGKGDRVCTPDGEGTVLEDELIPCRIELTERGKLLNSEIEVELDESTYKGKILKIPAVNLIPVKNDE